MPSGNQPSRCARPPLREYEGWDRATVDDQVLRRYGGPDFRATEHDADSIMVTVHGMSRNSGPIADPAYEAEYPVR